MCAAVESLQLRLVPTPHHAELTAWNEKLDAIGSKLTANVVEGFSTVNDKIRQIL